MAAYGRDIHEVMGWTYPQLRMMQRYRESRIRAERRWGLMLGSGTLNPEMWDALWQQLGGVKLGLKSPDAPDSTTNIPPTKGGQHNADDKGNVLAPGAPLLSDIALGKAAAPPLIPIQMIHKDKENDGTKRSDATPAGD